MKIDSIYYSPHQVASFFSISKDTLLYYDRIGLFSPVKRKKNGYRCYSASQLNELDTILTLRDLGVSIASIKETIGNISTPSFLSLLEDEERSIRGRIDECNALLDVVSTIRQSINAAAEAEKGRLYTAGFREQSIIRFPIRNSGTDSTSDEAWQEAYRDMIASADCKAIMTMGSIVHLDEAREHLGAICREVYATYAHPSDSSIPAGRYAFMYFQGSLDHLAEFYRMFFEALDSSHFVPIGDIYEELTISSIVTRDEKEHVTRLIVRIG